VKAGKSGSETLALLTLAFGEYAFKKLSGLEWKMRLKEGREDVQDHYCMSSLFFALCTKNARKLQD
jgi:hypothetical protein